MRGRRRLKPTRLPADDPRVAVPLYSIREAAGYLDIPVSTLQSWTTGAELVSVIKKKGHVGYGRIPFVGFAEAFVVVAARKHGLSTRRIKEDVGAIREDWGIDHALANRMIYADPKLHLGIKHGEHYERARDRQLQMIEAVRPQIEFIEFGGDDYADRITLSTFETEVIVSPFVAGGQPIVRRSGIRVRDVANRYALRKESVEDIAEDFGLTTDEVLDLAHAASGTAAE